MQVESFWAHATEPSKPGFSVSPEALNAVDMSPAVNKFIAAVVDSKVLAVADIDQAIIAAPAVGVDDAFRGYLSPYNGLQRGFGAIADYFGVDLTVAFEHTENDGFAICATSTFTPDASCAEV